jgi:hypothetical protein
MSLPPLTASQARAIAAVATRAVGEPLESTLRVTLHFHPDRLVSEKPILEEMQRAGVYRSQFETATSNGGLTAFIGGQRWLWESRIFAGSYDNAAPTERPKYGSLNLRNRATGGSPRFGSAYFRVGADFLPRTTFCYPDSVFGPEHFGVAERMALTTLAQADNKDILDDYIEAQIHGSLPLEAMEAVVLDPCFQNTLIETQARALPCALEWHSGFRVDVVTIAKHPNYRGQKYADLACSLAVDGWLTPDLIGAAARLGLHDEQDLKRVWHYVARFGSNTA